MNSEFDLEKILYSSLCPFYAHIICIILYNMTSIIRLTGTTHLSPNDAVFVEQ